MTFARSFLTLESLFNQAPLQVVKTLKFNQCAIHCLDGSPTTQNGSQLHKVRFPSLAFFPFLTLLNFQYSFHEHTDSKLLAGSQRGCFMPGKINLGSLLDSGAQTKACLDLTDTKENKETICLNLYQNVDKQHYSLKKYMVKHHKGNIQQAWENKQTHSFTSKKKNNNNNTYIYVKPTVVTTFGDNILCLFVLMIIFCRIKNTVLPCKSRGQNNNNVEGNSSQSSLVHA